MAVHVGAREAREKFADLIGRVHYGGEVVIVERSSRPMVAMIPMEMYMQMDIARERDFEVIDRFRHDAPDLPQEEVETDVAEAIAAVRAARRAEGKPV